MSGRIRTVKPEWLEDELLAAASDAARVLSVALLLIADDHGRGRASPATLATEAWRYEMERDDGANAPEVLAKASRALRELIEMRYVVLYEVNGQRYFEIRNWKKHQRVDRPSAPRVPAPIQAGSQRSPQDPEGGAAPSRVAREGLATDPDLRSPIPISDPDHEARGWSIDAFDRTKPGDLGRLADHIQRTVGDAQVAAGGARTPVDSSSRWLRLAEFCLETAAEPSRPMPLVDVIEQLVTGWASDAWAKRTGYPAKALTDNPQKYFSARRGGMAPVGRFLETAEKRAARESRVHDDDHELEEMLATGGA